MHAKVSIAATADLQISIWKMTIADRSFSKRRS